MPKVSEDIGPQKLLKHIPAHGILICKPCQFAIQPNALSSHLLRHQIYRSERKQLLEKLKGLDLREPEDVTYPPGNLPAITELPVYRGWICRVPLCGHACASEKRMTQHWGDQHGSREMVARTAYLQTFFRGNKIRYFEVSEPESAPTPDTDGSEDESDEPSVRSSITNGVVSDHSTNPGTNELTSSTQLIAPQFNMLNLQLMHQWSSSTCYTADRGSEPPDFWPRHITQCALSGNKYLMYGCLSAAAFHLASENAGTPKLRGYREIALEYQGYGIQYFRQAMEANEGKEGLLAFNRLLALTRCAEHHLDPEQADSAIKPELEGESLPIHECIMLLRGASDMYYKWNEQLPLDSGLRLPHEVVMGLADVNYNDPLSDQVFSTQPSDFPNIPVQLCQSLLSLPPRLEHTFHNLGNQDLHAFKHAFATLLTCFDPSYLPISAVVSWPKWNGVEGWTRMISDRFVRLLEECHPAAITMLAVWALLVKRLEVHCWFLQGETRRLFRFIREIGVTGVVDDISGFPV